MTLQIKDRVWDLTTTTGTSDLTLQNLAPSTYRSFQAVCSDLDTIYYAIANRSANEWEVGLGTFHLGASSLSRTTVLASSNGGSAVNFSAGTKDVLGVWPASVLGLIPVPGGSTGAFQFNNAGVFGGTSGGTWNAAPSGIQGTAGPGLVMSFTNPAAANNTNNLQGIQYNFTYDNSAGSPGFTNRTGIELIYNGHYGQAAYSGSPNQAKTNFLPLNIGATYHAAGQKNLKSEVISSYGMSDTSLGQYFVGFAGGPIAGDEGQGFSLASRLFQQPNTSANPDGQTLSRTTISTVTRSAIAAGITVTGSITGSGNPQTVAVSATTGINTNDWLIVNWQGPTAFLDMEAVQVTSVGVGTITAVFQNNQNAGATLTAALVLVCSNTAGMGQQRFIVNETKAAYTTGNVSAISGGGFTGSGTTWTNGMVGGSSLNIGAICLAADYYTGAPFTNTGASGTLNCLGLDSWYQISSVSSNTALGIFSFSTAGDAAYHGRGTASGTMAYTIRQAARILRWVSDFQTLICEPSTSTWSAGDVILCPMCPYPDVTGRNDGLAIWTTGGAGGRAYLSVTNFGARAFGSGISLADNMATGSNSDNPLAWVDGIDIAGCANGIVIRELADNQIPVAPLMANPYPSQSTVFNFPNAGNNTSGRILWGSGFPGFGQIFYNFTNAGMSFYMQPGAIGINSIAANTGINTDSHPLFEITGNILMDPLGASSFLQFGGGNGSWARIQGTPQPGGATGFLGQHGFDFLVNDGSDPVFAILSMGTQLPFRSNKSAASINPSGALASNVSNVTNLSAYDLALLTSVWTGSAAALRPATMTAVPASGVNNAPITWKVQFLDSRISYNTGLPIDALSVTETGVLFFGQNNIGNGSPINGINMDPSNATAIRAVKWPDQAGGATVTTSSTGSVPATSKAVGTAGQWMQDGTNTYLCYATSTSTGLDKWVKIAGTFTF